MTTSPPRADGPVAKAPAPRRWRAIVLWTVFFVLLVAGILFAFRFGASVPVLLDSAN